MRIRFNILASLMFFALASICRADLFPWDELLKQFDHAGQSLALGEERQEILDRLNRAIEKNAESSYRDLARRLSRDLSESIRKASELPKPEQSLVKNPEKYLMETTIPLYLIAFRGNYPSLRNFIRQNPRDPACLILSKDRTMIERLLPLLSDPSPTRSYNSGKGFGQFPKVARTCDVAMLMIEFFSQCRFHVHTSSGELFRDLPADDRRNMAQHIEKWWRENKDKSIATGIRSQLPHANLCSKVLMAKTLASFEGKQNAEDKEYGLQLLRNVVRENEGDFAVLAANALASFGDFTPIDVFYSRGQACLSKPGKVYDSCVVVYLTHYGKRREWELLTELARREIENGLGVGTARVWPSLVSCSVARSSPMAIPGVALALTQTRVSGSRSLIGVVGSQPFSRADVAAERLQELTSMDFGYRPDSSPEDRAAAIRKAHKWWTEEGKNKFTFDYIEEHLMKL